MPAMQLVQVFFIIWYIVFQWLLYTWPVSLVLLIILGSELEHAPRCWEKKYCLSLTPLAISFLSVLYVTLAIGFPPLRAMNGMLMWAFGQNTMQILMCTQLAGAGLAWCKLKGYRCFFLSLLLMELWIGFWCSYVTGRIMMQLY